MHHIISLVIFLPIAYGFSIPYFQSPFQFPKSLLELFNGFEISPIPREEIPDRSSTEWHQNVKIPVGLGTYNKAHETVQKQLNLPVELKRSRRPVINTQHKRRKSVKRVQNPLDFLEDQKKITEKLQERLNNRFDILNNQYNAVQKQGKSQKPFTRIQRLRKIVAANQQLRKNIAKNQQFRNKVPENQDGEHSNSAVEQRSFGISSMIPKNLVNKFTLNLNKDKKDPKEVECKRKGGALINNECYKYNSTEVTFGDARASCMAQGGDLWTPDPNDTFLYYKMTLLMPEFTRATDDQLWIGYKAGTSNTIITTIDGTDISKTVLAQIDTGVSADECLVLKFDRGGFFVSSEDCEMADEEFICELPLNNNAPAETNIHPLQFFKHMFLGRK